MGAKVFHCIGQAVMIKDTESKFLQPKYFGPTTTEKIFPNKMSVSRFDGKKLIAHESFLKPCEFAYSRSTPKVTTKTLRKTPNKRTPSEAGILFVQGQSVVDRFF